MRKLFIKRSSVQIPAPNTGWGILHIVVELYMTEKNKKRPGLVDFFKYTTALLFNLDKYRKFEIAINWDEGQFLGTQVIVANRKSRFLPLWLDSYREYHPELWYKLYFFCWFQ